VSRLPRLTTIQLRFAELKRVDNRLVNLVHVFVVDGVETVAPLQNRIWLRRFVFPEQLLFLALKQGPRRIGREAAALYAGFEDVQLHQQAHHLFFGQQLGRRRYFFRNGAAAQQTEQQGTGDQQGPAND
jgi:hypothetical protein